MLVDYVGIIKYKSQAEVEALEAINTENPVVDFRTLMTRSYE